MATGTWRDRLSDAISRSGRSERSLSIAIGRADGYVHGILKAGKEPGIDSFAALARELDMPLDHLRHSEYPFPPGWQDGPGRIDAPLGEIRNATYRENC